MYWIRLILFGVVVWERWLHSFNEAKEYCKGWEDFIVFQQDVDISQDIKDAIQIDEILETFLNTSH